MSQTIDTVSAAPVIDPQNEFSYRPVPLLAPISVFFGLCSIVALATMFALGIPLLGMLLGAIAVWQIRRGAGELGGKWVAATGLGLSSLFFFSGVAFHSYTLATEVPDGYKRVHFPTDISAKQFVVENGARAIHPEVQPLVDQKVFIKGYMWNNRVGNGLTGFVMLKDNGECCFGGDPAPYDMMVVRLKDGKTVNYVEGLVSVAGTLHANPAAGPSEPVYTLEADLAESSKTMF